METIHVDNNDAEMSPEDPHPAMDVPSVDHLHNRIDVTPLQHAVQALRRECQKVLIGQDRLIDLIFACILSDGHALIEGVPGIAKTLSAKVVAKALNTQFSRIQFTPDLLPSDIIGTSIYNMNTAEFHFARGPIFSNLILIDEINRAPAKTQSALFEVMEEKQITHDGIQYDMGFPFVVLATQNPIEQEGTYRLPEAQLDRFVMKIKLDYPSAEEEVELLQRYKQQPTQRNLQTIQACLSPQDIAALQSLIAPIHVSDQMIHYITAIIQETRNNAKIYLGGSPRASLALLSCSKITAGMSGRDFVIPDDITSMAPHILNHRLILTPEAEMQGLTTEEVIGDIIQTLEVPR